MKILLCGAADIVRIRPLFNSLMEKMTFEFNDYIGGTLGATNSNDWGQNSIEAVEKANLIVFVLIETAGDITWNTEYITAVNLGKPYILLCEEELATYYFELLPNPAIKIKKTHKFYNAKPVLDLLVQQKRTVITFNINDGGFARVLSKQINYELERATAQLQVYNRNKTVLEKVKSRNYKALLIDKTAKEYSSYFEKVLLDPFEHKEVRKRILYYFTIHRGLTDEQIIELFEDPEQGISRMAISLTPSLINSDNSKENILKNIVSFINGSTETGTIRRAINSIFEIDVQLGVKYIFELFPAHDIGTPRRVLVWLIENYDKIEAYLTVPHFKMEIDRLKEMCRSYSKPENLEELAKKLSELMEKK